MIHYLLIVSRQGKARLAKWYTTIPSQTKARILKEVTQLILSRKSRMCNVIEYRGRKVIYRRYASLFFVAEVGDTENELITLEVIHRYVEVLDKYFGSVCELDIIFNFQQAYNLLDELVISGEMIDSSMESVLSLTKQSDFYESEEAMKIVLADGGLL